jgi:hypothetical protein
MSKKADPNRSAPKPCQARGEAGNRDDDRTLEIRRFLTKFLERLRDLAAEKLHSLGVHPNYPRPHAPKFPGDVDAMRVMGIKDHYDDVVKALDEVPTMTYDVAQSRLKGYNSGQLATVCTMQEACLKTIEVDHQLSIARQKRIAANAAERERLAALMNDMATRHPDVNRPYTIANLVRERLTEKPSAKSLVDAHDEFGKLLIRKNGAVDQSRKKKSRD